jgi:hypothetical protein
MPAAFAASLTTLLVLSAPAGAFIHRGHAFLASLETSGENKLSGPSAVAVNEHSTGEGAGDVYVLDKGNNRVVRFGPNHEFLEAWGVGVGGGSTYERCKEAAECKPGVAGFGTPTNPQFDEPVAIAVDNAPTGAKGSPSSGDVYVVANRTWKRAVIYKLDFEGNPVDRLVDRPEEKAEPWPIDGVAVDQSGVLWVDREGESEEVVLERFNNEKKNKLLDEPEEIELPEIASSRPVRPGFALDSLGHAYVTYEPEGSTIEEEEELFEERAEERHAKKEPPVEERVQPPCQAHICLVAQLKVSLGAEERIEAEVSNPQVAPEENTTGVAADSSVEAQSSDDVYVDNVTSISAFTATGTPIQSFGQAQLGEGGGSGLAVNAAQNEVFAADAVHGRVDIYGPVPPAPPMIRQGSASATSVATESAKLNAAIDPTGSDTHYFFRVGATPCLSAPTACTALAPKPPGTDIGAGYGDQAASVELRSLTPSTTYHFVVVAENAFGKVEGQEEGQFTTVAANTLEAALPDGRAWELVSPTDKRGVAVEPLSHEGGLIQAAANGRGIAFVASAPVGEEEPAGNRAPEPAQLIASRASAGSWGTHNITTPNLVAQGIQADTRRAYQFFSSDLELGAVYPVEPLSSTETTEPVTGLPLYLRDTSCSGPHCYQPLENGSQTNPGEDVLLAATPDLKHIGKSAPNGLFEWSAEESEPGEGHMRLVSVLPSGATATNGVGIGAPRFASFEGARRAISQNGSRVVWAQQLSQGTLGGLQRLYQTEFDAGAVTSTQIDEPNEEAGLAAPALRPGAVYGTSSTTGDRVFFTDDQRLTTSASTENEASGDLYVYEPGKPVGERRTDLASPRDAGASAAVQSGLIGASEDGSYVYFVANGVLSAGATQGSCVFGGVRSAKCNLYVAHDNGAEWEKPKFIARLSNEDTPDWTAETKGRLNYRIVEMTSRVSPNGRFLAFMSDQRLTGYSNLDANSGEPDEEVFLYDASANAGAGGLVCASCNPTGAQPVGVHDVQESGEGRGLLVDRIGIWSTETEETANSHWLAASVPGYTNLDDRESLYQSRYLSNDGRLFFNAQDALVGQDVNGKEDVYEYEPTGAGGCSTDNTAGGCVALISSGKSVNESTFLDASESGNDVFFLTSARLIPSLDSDTAFDIYDARVCSGPGAEEACPATALAPAQPCSGEECRAAPAPQPSYGPPAGPGASGSGNAAPQSSVLGAKQVHKAKPQTRAQKLAAALKACKKRYGKAKKKRVACEKQARKKYGAKKSTKAKKAADKPAAGKPAADRRDGDKPAAGKSSSSPSKAKR